MRIALAWIAALVGYPVGSWFTRLFLTVVTLPLAAPVRDARSPDVVRALRLVGGAVAGAGGFALAAWASILLGVSPAYLLPTVLLLFVAFAHVPALRRLAGGPQCGEETFAFAGEELGLLAAAACHLALRA